MTCSGCTWHACMQLMKQYESACTAILISREVQEAGNYYNAHDVIFNYVLCEFVCFCCVYVCVCVSSCLCVSLCVFSE